MHCTDLMGKKIESTVNCLNRFVWTHRAVNPTFTLLKTSWTWHTFYSKGHIEFFILAKINSKGPQTWINPLHMIPRAWRKGEKNRSLAETLKVARQESRKEHFHVLMKELGSDGSSSQLTSGTGIWHMLQTDRQQYTYSCKVLALLVLAYAASWPAKNRFTGWFDFPQLLHKAWGQGGWGEGGDVGEMEGVIADWSSLTSQRLSSALTTAISQAATFSMSKALILNCVLR